MRSKQNTACPLQKDGEKRTWKQLGGSQMKILLLPGSSFLSSVCRVLPACYGLASISLRPDLRAQVGADQFSITLLVVVIHFELDWNGDIDQKPQVNAAAACPGRQATEFPFHL